MHASCWTRTDLKYDARIHTPPPPPSPYPPAPWILHSRPPSSGPPAPRPDYQSAPPLQATLPSRPDYQSSVAYMERLLTWQDPWASARCCGLGLYTLVCTQQLNMGACVLPTCLHAPG